MLAYTYIEKGKFGLTEKPKPKITDARDCLLYTSGADDEL